MKRLYANFGAIIILAIFCAVIFLNWTPSTILSGWDNLHPEFNFSLNIKRSLYAVWQEYQGLGLLGGMGHASDLPRQMFLWFLSIFLPINFLRYFFHFSTLFLGPLGVYFIIKKFILSDFKNTQKEIASFLGAIFYFFNLAALQTFYVPFEPFSHHFGFLPWFFLASLLYLKRGTKNSLIFLLIINIFAIPQGYVATLFLVNTIALTLTLLSFSLIKKVPIKRFLVIYSILFLVNSFWLLPNLYFLADSAKITISAKINQMATENNILQNMKYGDFTNTLLLKGFWFDNIEESGRLMMEEWATFLRNPLIIVLGYSLSLISIIGMFFAINKKLKKMIVFIPAFLLGFIILSSNSPIFSALANLFYQLPLTSQIFRTPFTKLSILVAFSLSIFYPVLFITITNKIKRKFLNYLIAGVFILMPIIFLYPVFQGHLLYEKNKAIIPQEYFQVFDFFDNQLKNTRIANFPQHTYWGWTKYQWNYSGSGFLWYGIEQPISDRAFDTWSGRNENYYWEISYALYSKNQELFEKVLEKYQINWLLVDGNIINPSSPKALYLDELGELISKSNKISLAQEFEKIKIYQVELETPVKDFVFLAENLPQIEPVYNWNNFDQAYLENGNYVNHTPSAISNTLNYYPFRSLFTGRTQEDLEFEIKEESDHFVFKNKIPTKIKDYQLIVPEEENNELVYVDSNDLSNVELLQPEVNFDGTQIEVKVPKVSGLYSSEIEPTEIKDFREAVNCQEYLEGKVENEIVQNSGNQFLRLKAIDAKNCGTSFWLPNLTHQLSYLITIEARHVEGKSLLFWIENLNSRKPDLETYFPKTKEWQKFVFIQPPMEEDGLGYSLHFDNISIGQVESINDLGKITINPIPFKFLTSLKLVNPQAQVKNPKLSGPEEVYHPNPSQYTVKGDFEPNQTLVLSQAYHQGWLAWQGKPVLGKRLKHVLVNNWQNGWIVEEKDIPIYILFWPQLLEYFGFLLLIGTFAGVGYYVIKK